MSLVEIFSDVDDFRLFFEPRWEKFLLKSGLRQRRRKGNLSLSEIMTIMIHFHQSGYRTFKGYYLKHVQKYLSEDFPKLVSYNRFVRLMARSFVPLVFFLKVSLARSLLIEATSQKTCSQNSLKSIFN